MNDCGTCRYLTDTYTHWLCNNYQSEDYLKHKLEDDLACNCWEDWNEHL